MRTEKNEFHIWSQALLLESKCWPKGEGKMNHNSAALEKVSKSKDSEAWYIDLPSLLSERKHTVCFYL